MQAILMTRLDEAQKTPDLLTRHDALPAARRARRFTGSRTVKRNVWGERTARRGRPVALGIAAAGQSHARGPRAGATQPKPPWIGDPDDDFPSLSAEPHGVVIRIGEC